MQILGLFVSKNVFAFSALSDPLGACCTISKNPTPLLPSASIFGPMGLSPPLTITVAGYAYAAQSIISIIHVDALQCNAAAIGLKAALRCVQSIRNELK